MATLADLIVRITADTKGLKTGFSEVRDEAEKTESRIQRMSTKLSGVGRSMTMGVTVPMVAGMAAATVAAASEEKEMAILEQALRNNAGATAEQVAGVEEWITKTQNATAIADGELRPALGALVAVTKDTGKAQDLMGTAMDLATAKGTSVSSMAEAIAKAYNGNIGVLGRYGVATKDAAGNTLDFDAIMQNANKTFGGSTAKAADTASGKLAKLKNSFADITEDIGTMFLPIVEKVAGALSGALGFIEKLPGPVKDIGAAFAILLTVAGPVLWIVGTMGTGIQTLHAAFTVLRTSTMLATTAQWLLNIAMSANPVALIVLGIVALIAIFVLLWKKCEWFRDFWKGLWGGIKDAFWAVVNFIKENWVSLLLTGPFGIAYTFIKDHFEEIKAIAEKVGTALGDAFWAAVRAIKDAFSWLKDEAFAIWNKMEEIPVLGRVLDIAQNTVGAAFNLATGDEAGMAANAKAITGNLPQFADGGVAVGPKSGYLAVLHGTETVTPGTPQPSVVVQVSGNTFVGNSKDAARAITDMVETEMGRDVNRAMRGRFVYA